MGVFLNVETQCKFLKMASNVSLQKDLVYATQKEHDTNLENCDLKNRFMDLDVSLRECVELYDDRVRAFNDLREDYEMQACGHDSEIARLKDDNVSLCDRYDEAVLEIQQLKDELRARDPPR